MSVSETLMTEMAAEVDSLGIAALRYQLPYMEGGGRRPDLPAACHAAVRGGGVAASRNRPSQGAPPDRSGGMRRELV